MTQGTATLSTRSVDPGAPTVDAFSTLLAYCEANGGGAAPSLSRLIDIEFEIEELSYSRLIQPARLGPCGQDETITRLGPCGQDEMITRVGPCGQDELPSSAEGVLVGLPHTS